MVIKKLHTRPTLYSWHDEFLGHFLDFAFLFLFYLVIKFLMYEYILVSPYENSIFVEILIAGFTSI